MMPKVFLVLLASLVLLAVYLFGSGDLKKTPEFSPQPSSGNKTKATRQLDVEHNGSAYRINWHVAEVPSNVTIGVNLDEKKTAKSIYDENKCQALINGGFYTESNDYIGLLYIDGKKVSNESKDPFFNGVFSITKLGKVGIGSGVPLDQIKSAAQSGPILVRYRAYQRLGIENDENKRRMVLAINDHEQVLFITIYDPVSGYLGPKLADVPEILKSFANKKDIAIVDAMNLDGGSASAFYTIGVALGEITHIGSYLCAR